MTVTTNRLNGNGNGNGHGAGSAGKKVYPWDLPEKQHVVTARDADDVDVGPVGPITTQMSAWEARAKTEEIRGHFADCKIGLLQIYDRKGYKSLKYATWADYCAAEGFAKCARQADRLVQALRVEAELREEVETNKTRASFSEKPIAIRHAVILDTLPTVELKKAAWTEAEKDPGGVTSAKLTAICNQIKEDWERANRVGVEVDPVDDEDGDDDEGLSTGGGVDGDGNAWVAHGGHFTTGTQQDRDLGGDDPRETAPRGRGRPKGSCKPKDLVALHAERVKRIEGYVAKIREELKGLVDVGERAEVVLDKFLLVVGDSVA